VARSMRLAVVQFTPQFPGRDRNWTRIAEWAERLEADVVVFPELSSCGYCYLDANEILPYSDTHDALEPLVRISREHNRLVVGGFAERDGDRLFNSAYVTSPEGFHIYRKIHLWNREKTIFEAGTRPLEVEFQGHRIGIEVCYDLQFPELATLHSHTGVELILAPTAWALEPVAADGGLQSYTHLGIATSLSHGIFTVVANRTGTERGATFPGESSLSDPWGRNQRLGSDEGILRAEIDFSLIGSAKRPNALNDLDKDARLQVLPPKADRATGDAHAGPTRGPRFVP
jgi:N-carbamoylputrescine amidase